MKYFRFRNWQDYENHRTRAVRGRLEWIRFPVVLDTEDYAAIMERDNGAEIYGVIVSLLQIAAISPERGALLRSDGTPHTMLSLARRIRVGQEQVNRAVSACLKDPKVLELIETGQNAEKTPEPVNEAQKVSEPVIEKESRPSPIVQFGEFIAENTPQVSLSEKDMTEMLARFSLQFCMKCAEMLNAHKINTGKSGGNDHHAIKKWVAEACYRRYGMLGCPEKAVEPAREKPETVQIDPITEEEQKALDKTFGGV